MRSNADLIADAGKDEAPLAVVPAVPAPDSGTQKFVPLESNSVNEQWKASKPSVFDLLRNELE